MQDWGMRAAESLRQTRKHCPVSCSWHKGPLAPDRREVAQGVTMTHPKLGINATWDWNWEWGKALLLVLKSKLFEQKLFFYNPHPQSLFFSHDSVQQPLNIPDVSGPLSNAWISLQMSAKLSPYSYSCHHWQHLSPALWATLLLPANHSRKCPRLDLDWLSEVLASLKALAAASGVTHSCSVPCPHGAGQVFHYPTENGCPLAGQPRTVWLTCTFQVQAGFFPWERRLQLAGGKPDKLCTPPIQLSQ